MGTKERLQKELDLLLAKNIDEIYKTYYSKENGILDFIYDLSIEA
jgi:hypothetical protein